MHQTKNGAGRMNPPRDAAADRSSIRCVKAKLANRAESILDRQRHLAADLLETDRGSRLPVPKHSVRDALLNGRPGGKGDASFEDATAGSAEDDELVRVVELDVRQPDHVSRIGRDPEMGEGRNGPLEDLLARRLVGQTQIRVGVLRGEGILRRGDHLPSDVLRGTAPVMMMLGHHGAGLGANVHDLGVADGVPERD